MTIRGRKPFPFANLLSTALLTLSVSGCSRPAAPPPSEPAGVATIQNPLRLPPEAFADLAVAIKADLKRRGCTIPQVRTGARDNVIRGHFTRPDQQDTAVLCSHARVSSILVFHRDSASDVTDLASAPDENFMQDMGRGSMEFSRLISPANSTYIREHAEKLAGPKPPPIDHEGINDIFIEKGSGVWYWYEGKWLELPGAD